MRMFDFKAQLLYRHYTHGFLRVMYALCVPVIVLSTAAALAQIPPLFELEPLDPHQTCPPQVPVPAFPIFNWSFLLLAAYSLLFVAVEPLTGALWAVAVGLPSWIAANAYQQLAMPGTNLALYTNLACWAWLCICRWGCYDAHAYWKRPGMDYSMLRSLALAPLFAWLDVLFLLGYKPELYNEVEREVQDKMRQCKESRVKRQAQDAIDSMYLQEYVQVVAPQRKVVEHPDEVGVYTYG